jgi:hypothetical protein
MLGFHIVSWYRVCSTESRLKIVLYAYVDGINFPSKTLILENVCNDPHGFSYPALRDSDYTALLNT